MIDFIAHDFWSAVWLVSMCAVGALVLWRGTAAAKRILLVLVANWIATRCIVTWAHDSDLAWIVSDAVACLAFALYGRALSAYAIAVLYFVILNFDFAMALGIGNFAQIAAVSDGLGFIALVILAGARHVDGGIGNRAADSSGGGDRYWGAASAVPRWGAISPRPGMPVAALARNQEKVQ